VAFGGYHAAAAQRHRLLPALHAVQDAVGWISPGAMNYVCERLSVPPADAYGVATFYALLSTEPTAPVRVHVCEDAPCSLAGAGDVMAGLTERLGPAGSGADVVWAPSPCLGACASAPAAFVQRAGEVSLQVGPVDSATSWPALPPPTGAVPLPQPVEKRHVLARVGIADPARLDSYREHGGYEALAAAIRRGAAGVIDEIEASGLRGRGGAAFPTGVKWRSVAAAAEPVRYVVCNADESEPGTFKDRALLEGDPFAIVEAMTIAGYAVGATRGYVYVRGEYPVATARLASAVDQCREEGLLGDDVAGAGFAFDIDIRRGAGAYICGEETALFNSIEGYRGEPRQKPPYPTTVGLFGKPTVVNNVETLANVPIILRHGGLRFAQTGTEHSTGTRLFCLSGSVAEPGVYELEFGATLRTLIELAGGVDGALGAVLLGGAAGTFVGADELDLPLTFEDAREAGVSLGSGAVVVFAAGTDFRAVTRRIAAFFRDESCGQCVPCRVGTVRQEEQLAALDATAGELDTDLLAEIDRAMRDASICGLGHTAGIAVQSAIRLGLLESTP
jgi:NADH-quinone oxidoreductase subunit F